MYERHVPRPAGGATSLWSRESDARQTQLIRKQVHRLSRRKKRNAAEAAVHIRRRFAASFDWLRQVASFFDLVLWGWPRRGNSSLFPEQSMKEESPLVVRTGGKIYTDPHHPHSAGSKQCGAGHLHGSRRGKAARADGRMLEGPYEQDQLPAQQLSGESLGKCCAR